VQRELQLIFIESLILALDEDLDCLRGIRIFGAHEDRARVECLQFPPWPLKLGDGFGECVQRQSVNVGLDEFSERCEFAQAGNRRKDG
jgi:hypothetical protein